MDKKKVPLKDVPEMVFDREHNVAYRRGGFLGKGGFARCYQLTNTKTNEVFAGKIVSKSLLQKSYQKEKMTQEVQIHKSLSHPHVVKLFTCFEDVDNVYITLELCSRRSLMELHKRRRAVTEPEARYFTSHVCQAIEYLHGRKIIHRDLKLGNLFLNEELQVKIGDFGLATTVDQEGERKKTLCGTPNYIAPEVLDKKGHSFEVDIWAVGCILYTLLFGKPPFETQTLKDTYNRIKLNQYVIPSHASRAASNLITNLLAAEPSKRPTIHEVLRHSFFSSGFMPKRLPVSCLTMAPKFNEQFGSPAGMRTSTVEASPRVLSTRQAIRQDMMAAQRHLNPVPENMETDQDINTGKDVPKDCYLGDLHKQLSAVVNQAPHKDVLRDDDEAPEAIPVFWISKWVDYSDKYGIGYQLCDNSVGVLFNDSTKLVLDAAGNQLTYIEKSDRENYYSVDQFPGDLTKKVTLLKYFRSYMQEHLIRAGGNLQPKDGDDLARLPVLRYWFRTRSAIILHLSNGTLQINYFDDHTKMVVCPLLGAVTYIDEQKQTRVFKLEDLAKYGCPQILLSRLKYGMLMVERLLSTSNNSQPGSISSNTGRGSSSQRRMVHKV